MTSQYEHSIQPIPSGARLAARVIVIAPDNRILLLRAADEQFGVHWWVLPGGGLQPGEGFEDAAVREVLEETGLSVAVSQCVWTRQHSFEFNGEVVHQYERFFVARTKTRLINPKQQDDYIQGHRWWSEQEICSSDERFAPQTSKQSFLSDFVHDFLSA